MKEKITIIEKEICDIHHKIDIIEDCLFFIFERYNVLDYILEKIDKEKYNGKYRKTY